MRRTSNTMKDEVVGNAATNYSYAVLAVNDCGVSAEASNRVGEFDFDLVPGTP